MSRLKLLVLLKGKITEREVGTATRKHSYSHGCMSFPPARECWTGTWLYCVAVVLLKVLEICDKHPRVFAHL